MRIEGRGEERRGEAASKDRVESRRGNEGMYRSIG
jgi:hypothetical protein